MISTSEAEVFMSKICSLKKKYLYLHSQIGTLAEWLGNGLQNRLQQFDSAGYLSKRKRPAYCRSLFLCASNHNQNPSHNF